MCHHLVVLYVLLSLFFDLSIRVFVVVSVLRHRDCDKRLSGPSRHLYWPKTFLNHVNLVSPGPASGHRQCHRIQTR